MYICSHDAVDAPIVLGDDGSDTEPDAATSDDDDDEHGLQDLNRTITASPAKAGSYGLSTSCPMERDGGGPSPEMEDQPLEPTGSDPTKPNPPSRKRSGPPTGSHVPSPKRSCGSSRVAARRSRETKKTSTCSDSHKEERLRHAFPRHCWDKE